MARGDDRARAPCRAVELRDVLRRRGRGDRRPRAVHRRRSARGAEVLPGHAAGRRGAPRGLLQALHGGGRRRRRRDDRRRPASGRAGAHLGLPQDVRAARRDHRRAAHRPLAGRARARGDHVPRRRRGAARAARPALHLRLPRQARSAARLPRRHEAGGARRAAPHRLRRQAPARSRAGGSRACRRPSPTCCAAPPSLSLAVFIPPNWDRSYTECFGFTLEEIYTEGARSLEAKLRSAGLPLESLPGPPIFPLDLDARGRAEYGLAMLRAGFLGPGNGAPPRDPAAMELLFASVARAVDHRTAPAGPFTVQWEFADAEPWHVRVDNGATAAAAGRAPAGRPRGPLPLRGLGRRRRRPARPAPRAGHRAAAPARLAARAVERSRTVRMSLSRRSRASDASA